MKKQNMGNTQLRKRKSNKKKKVLCLAGVRTFREIGRLGGEAQVPGGGQSVGAQNAVDGESPKKKAFLTETWEGTLKRKEKLVQTKNLNLLPRNSSGKF